MLRWATYFHFGRQVGGTETGSFYVATFNKERPAFDYGLSLDHRLARRGFSNVFVHDRRLSSGSTYWCGMGQDYWRRILTI